MTAPTVLIAQLIWVVFCTTRGTHMKEVIVVIEVETPVISANLQADFADVSCMSGYI